MTIEELITVYEKKLLDQKERHPRFRSTGFIRCSNERIDRISSLLKVLKNLNGETVKLREVCPACKSDSILLDGNDGECFECDHTWTRE